MTGDVFLFGNAVPDAAEHIVKQAVQAGTAEAFREAHDKLHGITTFLIFLQTEPSVLSDALLRLGNLRTRMKQLAENTEYREWALPQMRANRHALSDLKRTGIDDRLVKLQA